MDEPDDKLTRHIAELEEDKALDIARCILEAGTPGRTVLNRALEGLQTVGRRYESGVYYVAALVMAGEIMRAVLDLIKEIAPIKAEEDALSGTIILGTIEGDIHDLGKDLVRDVLQSQGFVVHDLGVDVAPERFLAQAVQLQPDLVAISVLLNACYPALTRATTQIKTMMPAGFKRPGVMVGGSAVDRLVFEHIKADIWCRDILLVADQCRRWLVRRNGGDLPLGGVRFSLV